MNGEHVVGIVPAAGMARRLGLEGVSKEMLPVPDIRTDSLHATVPVCDYLLGHYRQAGISRLVVVRREQKHDLKAHIEVLRTEGFDVLDLVVPPTPGSAHSISLACQEVPQATVAIGFPDIVLEPATLCADMLALLEQQQADVVLGNVYIPEDERHIWDLCIMQDTRVIGFEFKPQTSTLYWGWALAVWRPRFSHFMAQWLDSPEGAGSVSEEVSMGHVVTAGLEAGFNIHAVNAEGGLALDIGQPERRAAAARLTRRG